MKNLIWSAATIIIDGQRTEYDNKENFETAVAENGNETEDGFFTGKSPVYQTWEHEGKRIQGIVDIG